MPDSFRPNIDISTAGKEHFPASESSVTFARYEQASKELDDETILKVLTDTLEVQPGMRAYMIKTYLDNVAVDESDKQFLQGPERVIEYRRSLTDFVANRLQLYVSNDLGGDDLQIVEATSKASKQQLEADHQELSHYLTELFKSHREKWDIDDRPKLPRRALEFNILSMRLSSGLYDPLDMATGPMKSNITIQREIAGLFVHYKSDNYMVERLRGQNLDLMKRIYLNPRIDDSVRIFGEIIDSANDHGIPMVGKIFDRSRDAISYYNRQPNEYLLRGDGIVLYAGADADRLLQLVEIVYKENPNSFIGRQVSRVPFEIGDGVAIGDEPNIADSSLTSHRAELIGKAKAETLDQLNISGPITHERQMQAIAAFKRTFEKLAIEAGVNPKNIAFNLPKAA